MRAGATGAGCGRAADAAGSAGGMRGRGGHAKWRAGCGQATGARGRAHARRDGERGGRQAGSGRTTGAASAWERRAGVRACGGLGRGDRGSKPAGRVRDAADAGDGQAWVRARRMRGVRRALRVLWAGRKRAGGGGGRGVWAGGRRGGEAAGERRGAARAATVLSRTG